MKIQEFFFHPVQLVPLSPTVHSRAGTSQQWQHSSSCPVGTWSSPLSSVLPIPPQHWFVPPPADVWERLPLKWQWSQTPGLIYPREISLPRQPQGWQNTAKPNKGNWNAEKLWCSSGWHFNSPFWESKQGAWHKIPPIIHLHSPLS